MPGLICRSGFCNERGRDRHPVYCLCPDSCHSDGLPASPGQIPARSHGNVFLSMAAALHNAGTGCEAGGRFFHKQCSCSESADSIRSTLKLSCQEFEPCYGSSVDRSWRAAKSKQSCIALVPQCLRFPYNCAPGNKGELNHGKLSCAACGYAIYVDSSL